MSGRTESSMKRADCGVRRNPYVCVLGFQRRSFSIAVYGIRIAPDETLARVSPNMEIYLAA